ncbi:fimbrial protein [Entomohabitans teleogrylli]|uniref:fimbrial protein n=1 Tax=Entomohabitans teleogrylli TaxID=1384589 RepID=UPI00137B8890|nr:fimbrial protein [Entomohabitans teleogrylli]
MMMKKNKMVILVAAGLGISFIHSAVAADGAVNFSGAITETTCKISVNGEGASGAVVSLPQVDSDRLYTVGATVGDTQFLISLTDCSGAASEAYAFFEGNSAYVDETTGRLWGGDGLNNTAGNVQIELLSNRPAPIFVGDQASQAADGYSRMVIDSGSDFAAYTARYYANGPVTPGWVRGFVTYSIVYL